jgi:hypothetical protein
MYLDAKLWCHEWPASQSSPSRFHSFCFMLCGVSERWVICCMSCAKMASRPWVREASQVRWSWAFARLHVLLGDFLHRLLLLALLLILFFRVVWSPCRGRMVILWWINVDARRSIAVLVNSQLSPLVLYDSLLSILLLRSACLIGRIAYFDIGRPWSHIKYVNSF